MEKGVYGPAFGIFRSFLQQHANTRKENCYFLLILVSQYISQLGLLQNICYQGYMQMVQHQTICSRTPFSNCTGCTLRRGARQDWPSISIFRRPFISSTRILVHIGRANPNWARFHQEVGLTEWHLHALWWSCKACYHRVHDDVDGQVVSRCLIL